MGDMSVTCHRCDGEGTRVLKSGRVVACRKCRGEGVLYPPEVRRSFYDMPPCDVEPIASADPYPAIEGEEG
jgi:hypothetical protein